METSTIQVSQKTKKKLSSMKMTPGESYEELFRRIILVMDNEDRLTPEDIVQMETSIENIKKGKIKSLSEIRKKYPRKK